MNRRKYRLNQRATFRPMQLPFPHSKGLYKFTFIRLGFEETLMSLFFDFYACLFGRSAAPEAPPEMPWQLAARVPELEALVKHHIRYLENHH